MISRIITEIGIPFIFIIIVLRKIVFEGTLVFACDDILLCIDQPILDVTNKTKRQFY